MLRSHLATPNASKLKVPRRAGLDAFAWALLLVLWVTSDPTSAAERKPTIAEIPRNIDFNRDVRPILSEHCFACHGFDEQSRQADLRLDQRDSAVAAQAITPGDVAASRLWERITSTDASLVMPPPKVNLPVSDRDRAILKAWIEQGAVYAGHWSFEPPRRPELPTGGPPLHPIDQLVQARLRAEGLAPAPAADRGTLIRRLSFDLLGLPPSAEEVEQFMASTDPHAYEELVDRFLASEHFGERMALEWLDAARYADTNGFSIDGGRHLWLWRDWVIQAYNDNVPYDRFLTEQLAGDLLPNRTEAQLIATGFQRNNMVTHEGGTIPEENLTNYNADRVKTFGEAVLGLTLACAQCHDHKFDPITQRDYYQLFAYWNSLSDRGLDGNAGINPAPVIQARTVIRSHELPGLQAEIARLDEQLQTIDEGVLARWEARQQARLALRGRELQVYPVETLKVSTPNRGAGFEVEPGGRVRLRNAGDLAAFDILTRLEATEQPLTGLRVVIHPQTDLPGGGWGSGPAGRQSGQKGSSPPEKGTFLLTALSVTADAVPGDQVNLHKLQAIDRVTANSWDKHWRPEGCLDPRNHNGWGPDLQHNGPVHLTATFAQPIDSRATPYLTVQLNFGHGKSLVPGLIELQMLSGQDDGTDLPAEVLELLATPAPERAPQARDVLWSYLAAYGDDLRSIRVAKLNLEERVAVLTQPFPTMVMDVAAKPRDTFILTRGDYSKPGEKVGVGTIAALPAAPPDAPANRLGLAQWVTQPQNPLTARVAVNRLWQLAFGTGIVATPADFGAQGEWPSHPELLDWLAVDFVENGWNVKRTLRQIVLSQTYRQSSSASPAALERDPQNRLLARGPRFRLPAEFVRDSALKVSGLLVPRLGGPSVNPYAPGDLWREISHYGSTPATAQTFVQDHGEKLYRRSLYTYWKRTVPPPNMSVFDAPNREVCTVTRATTTTPLQAFVLLNDPQFVEAARAFGARIASRSGADSDRIDWAAVAALSRRLKPEEKSRLLRVLERERQRYGQAPTLAEAALSVGESPRDPTLSAVEHAAWMQVASLLLNLSESVTRN